MVDHLIGQILALDVRLLACHARLTASTDSEALHDLRTTVRRLRSLLRPLRGFSGVEQLEEAAKAVGQLTTPLRDLEVLAAHLNTQGMTEAARWRSEEVIQAYQRVANAAELNRLLGMLDQFPGFIRVQQRQHLLRGLRRSIEKFMDKQWKKLGKAMADPAHDRHRLRLLIKRVRYAGEAYPQLSHQSTRTRARLKDAQGALGDWHDHLQWLAQAGQQRDLAPCIPGWQLGIVREEKTADESLKRLGKACFSGRKVER
jgi:CHAD domain-containing protein